MYLFHHSINFFFSPPLKSSLLHKNNNTLTLLVSITFLSQELHNIRFVSITILTTGVCVVAFCLGRVEGEKRIIIRAAQLTEI